MSKSRQHWQEDSVDYTNSQYIFYLIVLGAVIAGLVWLYYFLVKPKDVPVTHFVHMTCQSGGELPIVPYQTEDFEAIEKLVIDSQRHDFNDLDSFDEKIQLLIDRSEREFLDVSTVMIWLSAVGSVANEKPVILGSEPGEEFEFETLLEKFNAIKAKQVILILDCNHGYADHTIYLTPDSAGANNDINQFSELAAEQLANLSGKVHVVQYGRLAERPIYSTTRRRSLIGFALEQTLLEQENKTKWPMDKFLDSLDAHCLEIGGTASPRLAWFGPSKTDVEFPQPEIVIPDDSEEAEESIHKTTDSINKKNDKMWTQVERLTDDHSVQADSSGKLTFAPSTIDADQWNKIHYRMASLTAFAHKSEKDYSDMEKGIGVTASDFYRNNESRRERIFENLDLVETPVDPEIKLSPEQVKRREVDADKRIVAKAYHDFHEMRFRLQHYVAFFDSLSWLLPDDNRGVTERYADDLLKLLETMAKSEEGWDRNPSLDDFDSIINLHEDVLRREQNLLRNLNFICRRIVPDLNGFQREMAVEAILRLPNLDIKKPEKPNEDRLPSRQELLGFLADNAPNTDDRISAGSRTKAAETRRQVYESYIKVVGPPGTPNEASRLLQVFAYQMPVSRFDFAQFRVGNRRTVARVEATKRKALVEEGKVVERTATAIDLGLLTNVPVKLVCELIQGRDPTGQPFFKFANAENSKEKITIPGGSALELVALRDAGETDPACKLNVTIVDAKDPTKKPYERFDIDIRLPSRNRIELLVNDAEKADKIIHRDEVPSEPIYTIPNHALPYQFRLRNLWHNPRKGTVRIYACSSPSTPTIVGRIDGEVKANTLNALETDKQPLALAAFDLAGGETKTIQWKLPETAEDVAVPADHGFLCLVKNETEENDWAYWVPVFPLVTSVARVNLITDSGDLKLDVERSSTFPKDLPIKIRWHSTGNVIPGNEQSLGGGKERALMTVATSVRSMIPTDQRPYLYVDVDGWPRKLVFRFNGANFMQATAAKDAKVEVMLGDPKKPLQMEPLTDRRGFDRVYGTNQSATTATVRFAPNVPSTAFRFATARDNLRVQSTGDRGLLFYPRKLNHVVRVAKKSGAILINSTVQDHVLTLPVDGNRFEVTPMISLDGGNPRRLDGENRVQIQFDRQPPQITDYDIRTGGQILPESKIRVKIDATDDGVGIDWTTGVEIFMSEKDNSLRGNLAGKPVGKYVGDRTFELTAPKETGSYSLGVKVTDRVGNVDQELKSNQVVMKVVLPRPKLTKKSPKSDKPRKKVFHKLVVNVSPSNTDLSNVSTPEISIKPADASPEDLGGGKYLFKGLKEDVQYTVTAECQLKSGIDRGAKLSGRTKVKFPKGAKSTRTKTSSISMKR